MHSSSDACGRRTINPHQAHRARGRSTISEYPHRKSRNEVVSPGQGGSAWPADGAARATTSAPLLLLGAIVGPWSLDVRAALVVPGLQPFRTMGRSRAGRAHSTAIVVAGRQKVAMRNE